MKKTIYSKEHKYIVEKLIQARKEAELSQIDIAKRLGTTQGFISKIESGQSRIDLVQLKEFAKLYKKNLDYFIS